MDPRDVVRHSKRLSYVLRHAPGSVGLTLVVGVPVAVLAWYVGVMLVAPVMGLLTLLAIPFAPRDGGWRAQWGRNDAADDVQA